MARDIEALKPSAVYPQVQRCAAMFEATLAAGAGQAQAVAEKIRDIVDSGTSQFRHPVGPDAEPFLGWRRSLSDEQWANRGSQSNADWLKAVKADFGMHLRLD